MKIIPARNRARARHDADLVVEQGLATKNRYGRQGVPVPLPDGCYELTQIEPPARRSAAP